MKKLATLFMCMLLPSCNDELHPTPGGKCIVRVYAHGTEIKYYEADKFVLPKTNYCIYETPDGTLIVAKTSCGVVYKVTPIK